jgi:hypothetical protein
MSANYPGWLPAETLTACSQTATIGPQYAGGTKCRRFNLPIVTISGLAGKKIGVNGTNSIGTLLISLLLEQNGIPAKKVHFITDPQGFPAMPAKLQDRSWDASSARNTPRKSGRKPWSNRWWTLALGGGGDVVVHPEEVLGIVLGLEAA